MSKRQDELAHLQVTSPCSSSWERMSGDEQQRYCDECQRFVYDFSKMPRRQIEAMMAASQGRICARLTRKEDGSLLTLELPPVTAPASRRRLPVASAVMTAILSMNAAGLAQPLTPPPQLPSIYAEQEAGQDSKKADAKARSGEAMATLLGNVLDPLGAVLPMATVTLINESTKEERAVIGSVQGYRFTSLPPGSYVLKVAALGFAAVEQTGIKVQAGQEQRVDVTMQVYATITMGGLVAVRMPSLRELYQESDLGAVVTVGDSLEAETEGKRKLMKTWLYVSATVKGEWPGAAIPLYHWVDPDAPPEFARGDKLLVFLNRRRSDDQKELLDGYKADLGGSGIKKLPEEALSVYLRRLEELANVLKPEKPEKLEVIEWLVRCAEDPATRWEGVSELRKSVERLCELGAKGECDADDKKPAEAVKVTLKLDQPNGSAQSNSNAQPNNNTQAAAADDDEAAEKEDLKIASLLTTEQKDRLLTALYKTEEIKGLDQELIELAQDWKDARLVPFLLTQLRRMEATPSRLAEDLVTTVADVLDDEAISALAKDYTDKAEYDDLDEIDNDLSADEKKEAAQAAATALAARKTMLQKFIFAAQSKVNLSTSAR